MSETAGQGVVAASRALPEARVLNYIGRVTTATRVRKVAGIGVFVMGLGYCGVGGVCTYPLMKRFTVLLHYGWGVMDALREAVLGSGDALIVLFFAFVFGMIGLVAMLSCLLVVRGNGVACRAHLFAVVLGLLMAIPFAVTCGMYCVDYGVPVWHMQRDVPLAELTFGGFLGACPVILLLKDLGVYLIWIARAPAAERASVPFLPLKAAGVGR